MACGRRVSKYMYYSLVEVPVASAYNHNIIQHDDDDDDWGLSLQNPEVSFDHVDRTGLQRGKLERKMTGRKAPQCLRAPAVSSFPPLMGTR